MAYGGPQGGSDVDVVLLSSEPSRYTDKEDWLDQVPRSWSAPFVGRYHGAPVRLPSGLEVQLSVDLLRGEAGPLDGGTQKVVSDGMRVF